MKFPVMQQECMNQAAQAGLSRVGLQTTATGATGKPSGLLPGKILQCDFKLVSGKVCAYFDGVLQVGKCGHTLVLKAGNHFCGLTRRIEAFALQQQTPACVQQLEIKAPVSLAVLLE